jgi:hypothetical protein
LHPYRDAALVKSPVVPPMRRWRGAGVLAAITAGAAVIDVVAGFPLFLTLMTLSYGGATLAVLGARNQRRAHAMVAELPFPVVHDSKRTLQELEETGRKVASLAFELRDESVFMFDAWPRGRRNAASLAHVLCTVGKELHATRGVVCARVAWGPGGPVRGSL